jgi:hypothetical protein
MGNLFGQPRLVIPGDVVLSEEQAERYDEERAELIAFVRLTVEMRAAMKAYYAKKVPPTEKRDLLIASRELEVKVDKAAQAVLAKIGVADAGR